MTAAKRAGSSKTAASKKPASKPTKAASSSRKPPAISKSTKVSKKAGRPPGSPNHDYELGSETITRCINQSCLSTEKEAIAPPQRIPTNTVGPDKKPCNLVINRRMRCTRCGQVRIDKEFHFVPDGNPVNDDG